MPRNTTGGSGHKRAARGDKKSGGRKAKQAAVELLDLIIERETIGLGQLALTKDGNAKIEALKLLQVGRIERNVGSGRMDVLCQDNVVRRCLIRGTMRSKKSGAYMEVGRHVVVALERPVDLDESDDEGDLAPTHSTATSKVAYIIGLFDESDVGALQKTRLNKRLFQTVMDNGLVMEDMFERDGAEAEAEMMSAANTRAKERKAKKSAAGGGCDDDIDLSRL